MIEVLHIHGVLLFLSHCLFYLVGIVDRVLPIWGGLKFGFVFIATPQGYA